MSKKKQVPHRNEISRDNPIVFRSSEDVIDIFNDSEEGNAKTLSAKVEKWMKEQANANGLEAFAVLKYPSKTKKAGMVFVRQSALTIPKDE